MIGRDNSGPAFPLAFNGNSGPEVETGMTRRDYFAAAALQGLIASSAFPDKALADECFKIADAMVERSNQ